MLELEATLMATEEGLRAEIKALEDHLGLVRASSRIYMRMLDRTMETVASLRAENEALKGAKEEGGWDSACCRLSYMGEFKEGLFHGSGMLVGAIPSCFSNEFSSRPILLRGQFAEGRFVAGTITFRNGDRYTGAFGCGGFCTGEGLYTGAAGGYSERMVFGADGALLQYAMD
jgi:hypothetical protein